MNAWQLGVLFWFFDGRIKKAVKEAAQPAPPEKKPESRVDFDLSYATPKGRVLGALLFIVFVSVTIACICTSHIFYALIAGFASLCALIWPYLKQVKNETP
jgi:hypothetical protein